MTSRIGSAPYGHSKKLGHSLQEVFALRSSRKIVFFFPSFSSSEATAPLGILAVSTPLERAGYRICLIDSTITPNFEQRVLEEVRDALCLAISLVTGPMIRETVAIARGVKQWDPAVFISVTLVLSAVALLAVWLPAKRASRLEPMEALRTE